MLDQRPRELASDKTAVPATTRILLHLGLQRLVATVHRGQCLAGLLVGCIHLHRIKNLLQQIHLMALMALALFALPDIVKHVLLCIVLSIF